MNINQDDFMFTLYGSTNFPSLEDIKVNVNFKRTLDTFYVISAYISIKFNTNFSIDHIYNCKYISILFHGKFDNSLLKPKLDSISFSNDGYVNFEVTR